MIKPRLAAKEISRIVERFLELRPGVDDDLIQDITKAIADETSGHNERDQHALEFLNDDE